MSALDTRGVAAAIRAGAVSVAEVSKSAHAALRSIPGLDERTGALETSIDVALRRLTSGDVSAFFGGQNERV